MSTLDQEHQMLIVDNANFLARLQYERAREETYERMRPSTLYRPALSIDGGQWCALYGENLQDGVAGFGDSPAEAFTDFDKEWNKKLSARPQPKDGGTR